MVFTSSRRKQGRNISYISNNRIFTTVNSHINSIKSNNMNTSNSDNVIGHSNLNHLNVHTESCFNKLNILQTETDIESSIIINNETIDEKNYVKKYNIIKIQ